MKERWRALTVKQFNRDCTNVPVKRMAKGALLFLLFSSALFGAERVAQEVREFVVDMTCVCR